MLATPAALSAVLFGDHGVSAGIRPGTTLIDMSTVGPDHVLEVAARLPDGMEQFLAFTADPSHEAACRVSAPSARISAQW